MTLRRQSGGRRGARCARGSACSPARRTCRAQLAADRDAIQSAYQDLGYESASVDARPGFSQNDTHVAVSFVIREGPRVFVDHVLIVGNVRTTTSTIERELRVKAGDPFSLAAINESQRRLTALGLFRRARITELRHGDETTRDLLITVEEAPPTTIGYGGGFEVGRLTVAPTDGGVATEQFDFAPRAFFEAGRRNVFGKNRSINLVHLSVSRQFAACGPGRVDLDGANLHRNIASSARFASRASSTPPPTPS